MAEAVFLDRDGTLIEDSGFVHEPGKVKLLPGVAQAIKQLNDHGFLVITVSNQSGIARGLYTVADYTAVQRRLAELLEAHGAHLDGAYFCPHHPRFTGPCKCRKPGVKLFRDAAQALDIDFTRSWWVGDRLSDVQPGAMAPPAPPPTPRSPSPRSSWCAPLGFSQRSLGLPPSRRSFPRSTSAKQLETVWREKIRNSLTARATNSTASSAQKATRSPST